MAHSDISDNDLIDELKERFENSRKAIFDITALNRKLLEMNDRLERAEAAKGEFLANMRNEVVDPVASIMGLSMQMQEVQTPAELAGLARLINGECSTLYFQMRNIFAAAELEAGTANPSICDVVVATIVDASVMLFRQQAVEKDIVVRTALEGDSHFPTDAANLRLIIDNLLANAVEYTSAGGCVDVCVKAGADDLRVIVRDEGPGIPEEDVQRIFERFLQLDSRTTRQHHGQGLGLTVVKALVDLLGGEIIVASRKEGGSVFSVLIPRPNCSEDDTLAEEGNVYVFGPPGS